MQITVAKREIARIARSTQVEEKVTLEGSSFAERARMRSGRLCRGAGIKTW